MLTLAATLGARCASAHGIASGRSATPGRLVYIVSHGWHVGLVLRRDDVADGLWPEKDALGPVRYLEAGWGDGDYYPARRGTIALALHATFCSRRSVLQVVGFDARVAEMFPRSKILRSDLSPEGLAALARHIGMTYARDQEGRAIAVAPAQYGFGFFYAARGHYRLRHNSNTWVAKALEVAGCPIDVEAAITAGSVLHQAVRFSRVIRGGTFLRESDQARSHCR
jgi:uncharacterized protein (TIGR02117 family)